MHFDSDLKDKLIHMNTIMLAIENDACKIYSSIVASEKTILIHYGFLAMISSKCILMKFYYFNQYKIIMCFREYRMLV